MGDDRRGRRSKFPANTLKVSAPTSLGMRYLLPMRLAFLSRYPDLCMVKGDGDCGAPG